MLRQVLPLLRQLPTIPLGSHLGATSHVPSRMGGSGSTLTDNKEQLIQQTVKENCVVIFSKTTCGFCRMAKGVFDDIGTPYVAVELNQREDGAEIQKTLSKLTGGSTVPMVFVNGQCIGGGTETRSLHSKGGLIPLLQQCSTSS